MGMGVGTGTMIGGGLQALGSLAGAYVSYTQAKKDRKLKKDMYNKENALNVQQLNMDLNRLAGMNASISGLSQDYRNDVYSQNGLAAYNPNFTDAQRSDWANQVQAANLNKELYGANQQAKQYVQSNNSSLAAIDPNQYKI